MHQVKAEVLPVNAGMMIDFPSGLVDVIMVGTEVGDKVKPMGHDTGINPRLNESSPGVDAPFPPGDPLVSFNFSSYNSMGTLLSNYYNEYGDYLGGLYGRGVTFSDSFRVLRDLGKIRLDGALDIDKALVVYLKMPEKISSQFQVHPYAQEAMYAFIRWKSLEFSGDRMAARDARAEFYNEDRLLLARMNKMSVTDVLRAVRKNFKLSIKT
jgi:hypothetical protein